MRILDILIPILPGHDVQKKSEFISFDDVAKEIENYCISKSIDHIYVIYGMSMGGVLTSYLWKNKRLTLSITQKTRERNRKVVRKAINSMVTGDMLDV